MPLSAKQIHLSPLWNLLFLGLVLLASAIIAYHPLFSNWLWPHKPFHASLEAMGSLVAIFLAILLLLNKKQPSNKTHTVWISCALLGMGLLDGVHATVQPGETFVWLHSMATLWGGFLFAMVWLPYRFPMSIKVNPPITVSTISIIFCLLSVFYPQLMPTMLRQENFTDAARLINVIGGVLFFAAALWFFQQYRKEKFVGDILFADLCFLFGLASVLFGFSHLWDAEWWLWHLVRFMAYLFALYYIYFSYKKTDAALLASKKLFHTLVEDSRDAIYISTREGKFIEVNSSMLELFGYTREKMIGLDVLEIYLNPFERKTFQQEIEEKGSVKDHEIQFIKKDGTPIDCLVTSTLRQEENGTILGYQGIVRNITQQKRIAEELQRMEVQLRQSYKMEAIGTMAGGIAHDFNNILAIIIGNIDMALGDLPEGSPAKYSIDQILKASNRAKGLVKQILAFSRQSEQELHPIKPCSIIEESLRLLRATTPTTVSIVKNLCRDRGTIMADPTQFHQLLMNLFSNAVYAMDEKGTLEVAGEIVDLGTDDVAQQPGLQPGPYLKLSVSDTGAGMDQATRERIFDPFYTTKKVDEGTGMGLSIVMGIVHSHGGMITVDSEPAQGTTFNIYFPIITKEEMQETEIIEKLSDGNERILFVDDEEMLATLGGRILKRHGYQVTSKTNGKDALEIFKSNPDYFDLVVTDQTMPEMSGAELAAELLIIRPDIPIIICSGYSKKMTAEKARELGIREFCQKPLDKKQLACTVRKVLDGMNVS